MRPATATMQRLSVPLTADLSSAGYIVDKLTGPAPQIQYRILLVDIFLQEAAAKHLPQPLPGAPLVIVESKPIQLFDLVHNDSCRF